MIYHLTRKNLIAELIGLNPVYLYHLTFNLFEPINRFWCAYIQCCDNTELKTKLIVLYCRTIDTAQIKLPLPGNKYWFEYHCKEADDSSDAQLWYRSHQQVTIAYNSYRNGEYALSRLDRIDNNTPLMYGIKFEDGFEGEAFEDEIMFSKCNFERPDPPAGKLKLGA